MSVTNPLVGPGMLDRERNPHILCKCLNPLAIVHYEGLGSNCAISFFTCGLWGLLKWEPPLKKTGDTEPGAENPFLGVGMFDRHREPALLTKICCSQLATCEYDGFLSPYMLITWLTSPCVCVPWIIGGFVWKPQLSKGGDVAVGAPIIASTVDPTAPAE
jgi:hypothetical protein